MISEVSAISFLGSCSIAAWRHNSCHCSRFGPCMDFLPHVPTGGMFLLIIEPDYIRETTFIGLRALCSPKLKLSLPSPWPLLPHRSPWQTRLPMANFRPARNRGCIEEMIG
jgi:hypothetical protein